MPAYTNLRRLWDSLDRAFCVFKGRRWSSRWGLRGALLQKENSQFSDMYCIIQSRWQGRWVLVGLTGEGLNWLAIGQLSHVISVEVFSPRISPSLLHVLCCRRTFYGRSRWLTTNWRKKTQKFQYVEETCKAKRIMAAIGDESDLENDWTFVDPGTIESVEVRVHCFEYVTAIYAWYICYVPFLVQCRLAALRYFCSGPNFWLSCWSVFIIS